VHECGVLIKDCVQCMLMWFVDFRNLSTIW